MFGVEQGDPHDIFTARKVMFSRVFVCRRGGGCLWVRGVSASGSTGVWTPSPRHTYPMVNKRAVRILLECILVQYNADSMIISYGTLKPSQWVLLFGVKLEQGCTSITGYTVQQIKL